MSIDEKLFDLRDEDYALFQAKLIPNIEKDTIIGVRIPILRKLAKELLREKEAEKFLADLPHAYYDENMLHSLIISEISDYDLCIKEVNEFLPYVDNWAVCDGISPKVFRKNREKLIDEIKIWSKSDHTYTCRFGIKMLMTHYLDEDFSPEYLEIPASIHSDEYYIQMMVAWFFQTALSKRWEEAISYLTEDKLDLEVHNKAIQKALESRRTTNQQREYLKTLRRR